MPRLTMSLHDGLGRVGHLLYEFAMSGKAVTLNPAFENPGGFGKKEDKSNPIPGPFRLEGCGATGAESLDPFFPSCGRHFTL